MSNQRKLEPLKISCDNADCTANLHCFRRSKKLSAFEQGRCQYCGAQLIDWSRIHKCDINDVENTFQSLKYEWIRHRYWHMDLSQRVINHARRKGRIRLEVAIDKRIRQSVGKPSSQNAFDGRQTPFEGHGATVITCGQHAVACCCRKCMEYWHGIPTDLPLTDEQLDYFKKLIMTYVDDRIPDLNPQPVDVPRIRSV
jgi:hypothetical protein